MSKKSHARTRTQLASRGAVAGHSFACVAPAVGWPGGQSPVVAHGRLRGAQLASTLPAPRTPPPGRPSGDGDARPHRHGLGARRRVPDGQRPQARAAQRAPAHKVRVKASGWIASTSRTPSSEPSSTRPVYLTNRRAQARVGDAQGRRCRAGTPRPPETRLVAGAMVFVGTPGRVVTYRDVYRWWRYVPGANWRHRKVPAATSKARTGIPWCRSATRRAGLCALGRQAPADRSRVGVRRARRPRAGDLCVGRRVRARRQRDGQRLAGPAGAPFPVVSAKAGGASAPARSARSPPTAMASYDMTGNAWQWVADWYRADAFVREASAGGCGRSALARRQLGPGRARRARECAAARHARRLVPVQRRLLPELPAQAHGAAPTRTRACRTSAFGW
jgi:hypothetical protein